jgi:hypothetical protein
MKKIIPLLLPAALLFACGQGSGNGAKNDSTTTNAKGTPGAAPESCYRRVQASDTFALTLRRSGNDLTGSLGVGNYSKDGSSGVITGRATGNVYRLLYTSESDSGSSVMEIFFRQEGKALLRGVGAMETLGDTVRYAQPEAVTYPAGERWEPVACSGK